MHLKRHLNAYGLEETAEYPRGEVVPLIGLEPTTPSLRIVFHNDFKMLDALLQRWTLLAKRLHRIQFFELACSTSYHIVARPFIPLPY